MQLYLSSYGFGNDPARMLCAAAANRRVGVIQNALDGYTDLPLRQESLERECAGLAALGLTPEELDLRDYFGAEDRLRERVDQLSYLWVVGGNTFVLRLAMAASGLDRILQSWRGDDRRVYGGYSAGVCVLAPSLWGIHLADEPEVRPAGYPAEAIWEGLNLIPFYVAPHYRSDHVESAAIERTVAYYIDHKLPFVALRDGEALTLEDNAPWDFRVG
jgi:dipeptidase E